MIAITTTMLEDRWVKDLLSAADPNALAKLIDDRVSWHTTGPFSSGNEKRTDIITSLIAIADSDDLYNQVQEATALLLYKIKHNKINDHRGEIIRAVLSLIRENGFTKCHTLLFRWLKENKPSNAAAYEIYAMAMYAFGVIQEHTKEVGQFWLDMWNINNAVFWRPAFYGLRKYSIELGLKELPTLLKRGHSSILPHIYYLWQKNKELFSKTIKAELKTDQNIAGNALNVLIQDLYEKDGEGSVNELFEKLRAVV